MASDSRYTALSVFAGGRPMRYVKPLFRDAVSGKQVSHYVDQLGRDWMAEDKWALFRVPYQEKAINDGK